MPTLTLASLSLPGTVRELQDSTLSYDPLVLLVDRLFSVNVIDPLRTQTRHTEQNTAHPATRRNNTGGGGHVQPRAMPWDMEPGDNTPTPKVFVEFLRRVFIWPTPSVVLGTQLAA